MTTKEHNVSIEQKYLDKMMSVCATSNVSLAINTALKVAIEDYETKHGEIKPVVDSLSNIETIKTDDGKTSLL